MKNLKTLFVIVLTTVFLTSCGNNESPETETKTKVSENVTETVTETQEAPQVGMIWKSIEQKQAEIEKIISTVNFEHLHETRDIVNLLQTLPARSQSLGIEKIDEMNSLISEMSKLSLKIDELSHSGKSTEVPEVYATFEAKLNEIKSMYPKESFED